MIGTISVAGVLPRIGTTTLCMQLIAFLQENGYSCCYVEMSRQDYIWAVSNVYEGVKTDRSGGKSFYAGIEMFSGDRLKTLLAGQAGNYDYIVCDYGSITDQAFTAQGYAASDCMLMLCGNKPNEIFKTEDMLGEAMFDEAVTIFNFTDPADQGVITEMMEGRGATTIFMPYMPDPFGKVESYARSQFFLALMDMVVEIMDSGFSSAQAKVEEGR